MYGPIRCSSLTLEREEHPVRGEVVDWIQLSQCPVVDFYEHNSQPSGFVRSMNREFLEGLISYKL
jgi:hypothetical protein